MFLILWPLKGIRDGDNMATKNSGPVLVAASLKEGTRLELVNQLGNQHYIIQDVNNAMHPGNLMFA